METDRTKSFVGLILMGGLLAVLIIGVTAGVAARRDATRALALAQDDHDWIIAILETDGPIRGVQIEPTAQFSRTMGLAEIQSGVSSLGLLPYLSRLSEEDSTGPVTIRFRDVPFEAFGIWLTQIEAASGNVVLQMTLIPGNTPGTTDANLVIGRTP